MPEFRAVKWREDRNDGRFGVDKGGTMAALGRRPQEFRVEYIDGAIVITDPNELPFQVRE